MVKMPILSLSAEAVQALARATLGGPNCRHKDGFEKFLDAKDKIPLSRLSPYFYYGPDTFLINYAVRHKKYNLKPEDIARAYCLDHIPMVASTQRILLENGYEDEYFKDMRERDFPPPRLGLGFDSKRLALGSNLYLFSCIGKVGRVVSVVKGEKHHRVRVFCPYSPVDIDISNVITLTNVTEGDYIVIHFASGLTRVSRELALKIIDQQQSNEWFSELLKRMVLTVLIRRRMDLTDWFGKDLAAWTVKQLTRK